MLFFIVSTDLQGIVVKSKKIHFNNTSGQIEGSGSSFKVAPDFWLRSTNLFKKRKKNGSERKTVDNSPLVLSELN